MEAELGSRLLRAGWAAFWISQSNFGDLLGLAKLVNVRSLAGPGDPAQKDGSIVGRIENIELMSGQTDESTIRRGASRPGLLVGPELRCDCEDALKTGCKHACLRRHVQVVINLVVPIEVREALSYRVCRVHEINADKALVPFGFLLAIPTPSAALNFLSPFVLVAADYSVMDDDQTAAALQKLFEV